MISIKHSRLALASAFALAALTACSGGDSAGPPPITNYALRLNGATADHGAVTLTLRNVPLSTTFSAASGLVLYARPLADGQGVSLLVAGDLTRTPLVTFAMPKASTQIGSVTELAKQDGSLVNGSLPGVVIAAQ